MTRFKKILFWITLCFIFCSIVVLIFISFSDKLINQESITKKIQAQASEAINGNVTFQRLHVSFFPRPQLTVQQCRFSIPETAGGTVASLTISPKLLPLIQGKFQGSRIALNTPDIEIYLVRKPGSEDKHFNSFSFGNVEETVGAVLSVVLSKARGLHVQLKKARLNILKENKSAFWLEAIQANFNVLKDHINFGMHCDASLCKNIFMEGAVYLYKDKQSLSLENLKLDYPRLNLSGKLDIHRDLPSGSPSVDLELMGKDVDVSSTRKAALDLVGEFPVVNTIFKIVKGGNVPLIQLTSHGKSIEELGILDNITIKSNITNGEIFVPKVHLDLTDVEGDVTISKGILKGQNLKARMGASKCLDGILELGLEGKDALFHLDLSLVADLSQVAPILERVVDNEIFIENMALLDNVKGTATGRLILGERINSIMPTIKISQFNLSANYRRLPYPLKISGGQYVLEGSTASVENLSGSMGKSTFTAVSSRTDWDKAFLKVTSGMSEIYLNEIYPWLVSSKIVTGKLQDLKDVQGVLKLSSIELDVPFLEPENYTFKITGEVHNLAVNSPLLPGPLGVATGNFDITPESFSMSDFQARIQETSLRVSGTLKDYLKGPSHVDTTFDGKIGPGFTRWAEDTFNVPPDLQLNPPISVLTARVTWNNQRQSTFSGDLSLQNGIKVSSDFLINPDQLAIKKLVIQDNDSHASIQLSQKNRVIDLFFAGNLQKTTMDNLMTENRILGGQINGDFQAHIPLDQPFNSRIQGELQAENLILSEKIIPPLVINTLSLNANKERLKVESARLFWADNGFDFKGDINFSADLPELNLELYSDVLNLDLLKQNLDKNIEKSQKLHPYPVRGVLKLKTENLIVEGLTWNPFQAGIRFSDKVLTVSITNAKVCGITTSGVVEKTPQALNVDLKPVAQNQALNSTVHCLFDRSSKVKGNFNLKGHLTARETDTPSIQSFNGNLKFDADQGRFYAGKYYGIIINIFRFLNVTKVFEGELPDPEKEGFEYNFVNAKADIEKGNIRLNEMIIDSPSMNIICQGLIDISNNQIDVTAVIAPLKTIDFFIEKIPLVKDILRGSLISIPVRISGNLENPSVTPLSPSAVGSGLLGIVKRTLQLPFKLIQPDLPDKENN